MSYRHSWSKMFKAEDFMATECVGTAGCPVPCPEHEPYCYRATGPYGFASSGLMRLMDVISIPTIMPGSKQKILTLSIKSTLTGFWGAYVAAAYIRLVADGAEIFRKEVYHYGDKWRDNVFEPNLDISRVKNLDFQFYMVATGTLFGWATLHCAEYKVDAEYYSETQPETATVKFTVRNKSTGALVKNAYVALMSGAVIVADGYTGGDGNVSFANVEEGSYTAKVLAGGYYDFGQSIEVEAPTVWYDIKIVPIPVPPIPTWVWYAVGGVAALGAVVTIPAVIRRKPEEKVIVVR